MDKENLVEDLPKLYALSSTGKVKEWQIFVYNEGEHHAIVVRYGYKDGKIKEDIRKVTSGKNIGRSNETTIEEQAKLEATSKWKKQLDKGYVQDESKLEEVNSIPKPMLAHDYKKRSHNIKYPAYVQPKLNGIRCLAHKVSDTEVVYYSRGNKTFVTLDHLTPFICDYVPTGAFLDGEIYVHKELTFQEIVAATKREKSKNPNTEKLQYWVYDILIPDKTFSDRIELLYSLIPKEDSIPIRRTSSYLVKNEEEMLEAHSGFMEDSYEGTMVRNVDGLYKPGYRSVDLQKYKDFIDDEFKIIGGREGVGKDEGTIIFTCETSDGKSFEVRPRGSVEQRKSWFDDLDNLINKMLIVRYQALTDDGKPQFPVGISIRDYE